MNISWPVGNINQYRITQYFGENPDWYKKYGLIAHNGIDIGLPFCTHVVACDEGKVITTGNDVKGYGKYVKLWHKWGESVYAHASYLFVYPLEKIQKGQPIMLSGSSGFSSGPHLHFGMRVSPINYNNGYNGYVDPLPFLEQEEDPIIIDGDKMTEEQADQIIGALIAQNILKRAEVGVRLVTRNEEDYFLRIGDKDYWIPDADVFKGMGYADRFGKAEKVDEINAMY